MIIGLIGCAIAYAVLGFFVSAAYFDTSTSEFARWVDQHDTATMLIALILMWPVLVLRFVLLGLFSVRRAKGLIPAMAMYAFNALRMK